MDYETVTTAANVALLQGERHGFAVPVLCMT
ncbi:hypothetical protein ACZ87_03151, partial [Candidatus Erwinia dacicola]